jgi:hypothetical protein
VLLVCISVIGVFIIAPLARHIDQPYTNENHYQLED